MKEHKKWLQGLGNGRLPQPNDYLKQSMGH